MSRYFLQLHLFFNYKKISRKEKSIFGGDMGIRTPGLRIANASLYQLSYIPTRSITKKWCLETESDRRHRDFQSLALPTELSGLAEWV